MMYFNKVSPESVLTRYLKQRHRHVVVYKVFVLQCHVFCRLKNYLTVHSFRQNCSEQPPMPLMRLITAYSIITLYCQTTLDDNTDNR